MNISEARAVESQDWYEAGRWLAGEIKSERGVFDLVDGLMDALSSQFKASLIRQVLSFDQEGGKEVGMVELRHRLAKLLDELEHGVCSEIRLRRNPHPCRWKIVPVIGQ